MILWIILFIILALGFFYLDPLMHKLKMRKAERNLKEMLAKIGAEKLDHHRIRIEDQKRGKAENLHADSPLSRDGHLDSYSDYPYLDAPHEDAPHADSPVSHGKGKK